MPAGESHIVEDALVVCLAHKTIKRGECASSEQFQITDGAFGQLHGRQLTGVGFQVIVFLRRHHEIY
jgi:hypothetical protein